MQARTYLPVFGKFAQVDPVYDQTKDDPESWNLYNYVTNNPVTHTDPDGRAEGEQKPEEPGVIGVPRPEEAPSRPDHKETQQKEDALKTGKKTDLSAQENKKPEEKKSWWSSFWHGLKTGDGSGPENKPGDTVKDAREDIHKLAGANGTAARKGGDAGLIDPDDKAAVEAAGLQGEVGRNLPAAALRGAEELEGTINTDHKIVNSAEALGVKIHNVFVDKAKDKIKEKVKDKLGVDG